MSILKVRNPVAESLLQQQINPAQRLADLNGKRIGLYWNMKAGGDVALSHVEVLLQKRYPSATFVHYEGSVGFVMRHCTPPQANRIAKEVDAVVGATAD